MILNIKKKEISLMLSIECFHGILIYLFRDMCISNNYFHDYFKKLDFIPCLAYGWLGASKQNEIDWILHACGLCTEAC